MLYLFRAFTPSERGLILFLRLGLWLHSTLLTSLICSLLVLTRLDRLLLLAWSLRLLWCCFTVIACLALSKSC